MRLNFVNVRGRNRVGSDRCCIHIVRLVRLSNRMIITKTYHDVPSTLDGGNPIRIFVIAPNLPGYPQAKFPGRSAFVETVRSSRKSLISSGSKALSAFLKSIRSPAQSSGLLVRSPATDTLLVGGSGHHGQWVRLTLSQRALPPITSLRALSRSLMIPKVNTLDLVPA